MFIDVKNPQLVISGMAFPEGTNELTARLWMFSKGWEDGYGRVITADHRMEHLVAAVDLAFNCEGSIRNVIWNEWTETILKDCIGGWEAKNFTAFAGCSSSGKSDGVALYGLMEYWARPTDTFFVVMSTTKQDARLRIWKSITQLWGQAEMKGCPGKLIDSDGYIKGVDQRGKLWRNSGVILKAAGKDDEEDAAKELLGIKNPNVIVAADEFNELGIGILNTAYENMTSNERLKFFGMANPDKISDPFGELCEPEGGWKKITEADELWKSKYGKCRRFIAEKSPRIKEDALIPEEVKSQPGWKSRLHWQPDQAYCDRIAANRGGVKSRGYYRFVKAFWCPDGAANSVYSEAEFLNCGALNVEEPAWDRTPLTLTGLDPSFSRGGDRSQMAIGKVGLVEGKTHLHICLERQIEEDITDSDTPMTHQVVRQWRGWSLDFMVRPNHATMDNTGAGTPLGHVVDLEWSPAVHKVNFQGRPSGRKVNFRNKDCDFYNKNSELWIQPKELFRSGQISGLSRETMSEMIDREYHDKEGRLLRVESKEEAKKRLKKSPDRADAILLMIDLALALGYLRSEEVRNVAKVSNNQWTKAVEKKQVKTTFGRKLRVSKGRVIG
jgi:hypothetical protein